MFMWGTDPQQLGIGTHTQAALLQARPSDRVYKIKRSLFLVAIGSVLWLVTLGMVGFNIYASIPKEAAADSEIDYSKMEFKDFFTQNAWCLVGPFEPDCFQDYNFVFAPTERDGDDDCMAWGGIEDQEEKYYGVCNTNTSVDESWCDDVRTRLVIPSSACRDIEEVFIVPSNFTEKGAQYFADNEEEGESDGIYMPWVWSYTIALDIWAILLIAVVAGQPTSVRRQGDNFEFQTTCCGVKTVPISSIVTVYTIEQYNSCAHNFFFKNVASACWAGQPVSGYPAVALLGLGCWGAYRFSMEVADFQEFLRDNNLQQPSVAPVQSQLVTATVVPMTQLAQSTGTPAPIVKVES